MLQEYFLKKALDACYEIGKKIYKESKCNLISSTNDLEQSIKRHLQAVEAWSAEVSFIDLKRAKRITDVFIEVDLYVQPRRVRIYSNEQLESVPVHDIFELSAGHIIILGQPGAGKTTTMQHFCQLLLHDEAFCPDRFSFPLLIRFRDLNHVSREDYDSVITREIYNILGLRIDFPEELRSEESAYEVKRIKDNLVLDVLEQLHPVIILDGFDELVSLEDRETAISEIRDLTLHLSNSALIVTSRTGEFVYHIPNTSCYEICPPTKAQMSSFSLKWLGEEKKAAAFVSEVYKSPFADTTIRPLTLAHLCAIYERIGKIPEKPKTVYKKIIGLLLDEWDQQRSVKRVSRYAHFETDRKFDFLCHLAYVLTCQFQRSTFSKEHLLGAYQQIYADYNLSNREAQQVVSELETHTGLLLQSGYEEFEFAHKSLQEYLTAEYLVKLPSLPIDQKLISNLPNELAIAVSISSNSTDYLSELAASRLINQNLSERFFKIFLNRLLLEKPDFNSNFRLGLSLLGLYSTYIQSRLLIDEKLDKVSSSCLIEEFDTVLDLILRRSSTKFVDAYYKIDKSYSLDGGDEKLHRMLRKLYIKEDVEISPNARFPNIIYIRSSLLNEEDRN